MSSTNIKNRNLRSLSKLLNSHVLTSIQMRDHLELCLDRTLEKKNIPTDINLVEEFATTIAKGVVRRKVKAEHLFIVDYGCGIGNVLTQLKEFLCSRIPTIKRVTLLGGELNERYANYAKILLRDSNPNSKTTVKPVDFKITSQRDLFTKQGLASIAHIDNSKVLRVAFVSQVFIVEPWQRDLEQHVINESVRGTFVCKPSKFLGHSENAKDVTLYVKRAL